MSDRRAADPILLTGATGYVGSRLLPALLERGHHVRALSRRADREWPEGVEGVQGDPVEDRGLDEALEGVGTAYYLVHSMGRGSEKGTFEERDRQGAVHFGDACVRQGVERVVYLGGLGPTGDESSPHLRSRHQVAMELRSRVPQLVYLRAAMVIGAGSTSFDMLRDLVVRLPAMVTPRWVETRSQPVAISDVVSTLVAAAEHPDVPDEVQVGGADVLTYREMIDRFAKVLDKRPPAIVGVPVLSPKLSSYWVELVTSVDRGLVGPLVEGLKYETVVEHPPPPGLNDHPKGFDDAVREALAE